MGGRAPSNLGIKMNEKLEELQKLATDEIMGVKIVDQKKFAKLIIDECIVAVKQTNTHHAYTSYDQNLIQATIGKSVEAIRKHFE
jgi:hypothetical protein